MDDLPYLGVGISYRPKWRTDSLAQREHLDCLEVIAEHYLEGSAAKLEELDRLRDAFPMIPHGVGMSFGTDAPLDDAHVRKTVRLVERVRPAWFTEHLAFTHARGWDLGHLAPLPFTHEAVDAVCRNVQRWREAVGVPLVLENIAYMVTLPGDLSEAQFLTEVLERADCGLLLDLHNLYTNAVNHGYDAIAFIESLPLQRVMQIHLGGGHDEDGYRVDSHSAPTPEPVWDLLRYIAPRACIRAVIIEWDVQLPSFEVMLREVERAKAIVRGGTNGVARPANRAGAALY